MCIKGCSRSRRTSEPVKVHVVSKKNTPPSSTVTNKGSVKVPKEIRECLDLQPGDRVEFHVEQTGAIRLEPIRSYERRAAGMFRHKAQGALSTEEMDKAIEKAFRNGKL